MYHWDIAAGLRGAPSTTSETPQCPGIIIMRWRAIETRRQPDQTNKHQESALKMLTTNARTQANIKCECAHNTVAPIAQVAPQHAPSEPAGQKWPIGHVSPYTALDGIAVGDAPVWRPRAFSVAPAAAAGQQESCHRVRTGAVVP